MDFYAGKYFEQMDINFDKTSTYLFNVQCKYINNFIFSPVKLY